MGNSDGLHWDEEAEDHISLHQVTIDEVEEAVANNLHLRRSGRYFKLIGQTEGGRYLTVILDREGTGYYPVTARDISQSERKLLLRAKPRRRGR